MGGRDDSATVARTAGRWPRRSAGTLRRHPPRRRQFPRGGRERAPAEGRGGHGAGPDLHLRLTIDGTTVVTDRACVGSSQSPPAGQHRPRPWAPGPGSLVLPLARADANVTVPEPWPSVPDNTLLITGTLLPAGQLGPPRHVTVDYRVLVRPPAIPPPHRHSMGRSCLPRTTASGRPPRPFQ